jgi:tetraacyldisaccharide 4'-kinase
MDVRAGIARGLESGASKGPCAKFASGVWGGLVRVRRPLRWRDDARVVVVGGSTLGGSGKTPLAVACAEELRRSGARVALVGHGYGASPGRARFVCGNDDVQVVGDEALDCARRLAPIGVAVVVAKARQEALDFALRDADVVVVDGPCQTRPRRATLALLAVDGDAPWGAGSCPPCGDLRAPIGALLAATDRVVVIGGAARSSSEEAWPVPVDRAEVVSRGARVQSRGENPPLLEWASIRPLRLGLWTAMARPERVLRALERRGIFPRVSVFDRDHYPRGDLPWTRPAGLYPAVDLWLTTSKSEGHLDPHSIVGGHRTPVAVLDHAVSLCPGLRESLQHVGRDAKRSSHRNQT